MDTQTNPLLKETKDTLYKWLSCFSSIIILFFCIMNILMKSGIPLIVTEGILSAINLYLFSTATRKKVENWHFHILMLSISITILYPFYNFYSSENLIICWFIILPPIYCILAGKNIGLIYTVIVAIPVIYILSDQENFGGQLNYRPIINFTLSYSLAYCIFRFYADQYSQKSLLLSNMAFQDSLTGAKNRHALKLFFDDLNRHTNKESDFHLVVIDLDHFKAVNDEFGHDIGDSVLVELVELLQSFIGNKSIYRVGGEEFLIMLHKKGCEQSLNFAEMIRQKIEKHVFIVQEHEIKLTVSIGVAKLNAKKTYKDFLREADQNLYSAKSTGRNRVYHSV